VDFVSSDSGNHRGDADNTFKLSLKMNDSKSRFMVLKNLRWLWVFLAMAALSAGYLVAKKVAQRSPVAPQIKFVLDATDSICRTEVTAPFEINRSASFKIDKDNLKFSRTDTYSLSQSDFATFTIVSPCDGNLTIHGYNKDWPLIANQESTLMLTAKHTGRFPMHVHCSQDVNHIVIGTLEVVPQQ
jgi:hypothetical protein